MFSKSTLTIKYKHELLFMFEAISGYLSQFIAFSIYNMLQLMKDGSISNFVGKLDRFHFYPF